MRTLLMFSSSAVLVLVLAQQSIKIAESFAQKLMVSTSKEDWLWIINACLYYYCSREVSDLWKTLSYPQRSKQERNYCFLLSEVKLLDKRCTIFISHCFALLIFRSCTIIITPVELLTLLQVFLISALWWNPWIKIHNSWYKIRGKF